MMKLIVVFFTLCCATFSNASSSSEGTMVPVELTDMENTYVVLSQNLGPAYLYTSNDIGQQLADIAVLTGVNKLDQLTNLYAQYLTAYAVSKVQVNTQFGTFAKLFAAPIAETASSVNVLFTEDALNVFTQAGQIFSDNCELAENGITTKMASIESMISDSSFIVESDDNTFEVAPNLAENFNIGFSNFYAGNKGILQGLNNILALNSSMLMNNQNNAYATYFLNAIFNYYSHLQASYSQICQILHSTRHAFGTKINTAASMATGTISGIIAVATQQATELSNQYLTLNGVEQALQREIANQSVSVFGMN